MRRFYFIVAIATLSLAACNNEADSRWESWMDNVPGLENNKDHKTGESYTSYMGHPMPLAEDTYNRMMGLLNLASTQQGAIDDKLFVEMLTSNPLMTEDIFMADVWGGENMEWYGVYDYVGVSYGGIIQANEDGTITTFYGPAEHEVEVEYHMSLIGIKGFYTTCYWEYNADSNILISSYNKTSEKMTAQLLYFDGSQAVMVGQIAGISNTATGIKGNSDVYTEFELHLLKFGEDGKKSTEDYAMGYTYEYLRALCHVEQQLQEILLYNSDFDANAIAEELTNSMWRECGYVGYYDETHRHIEDLYTWMDKMYCEGYSISDYTFNAEGSGNQYHLSTTGPDEHVNMTFIWKFDPETRVLTINYDEYNTDFVATIVAYMECESEKYMVLDIANSTERLVIKKVE